MTGPASKKPKRTFGGHLANFALLMSLCVLASASWAQFQVGQRQGWTPVDWQIDPRKPLEQQIQAYLESETTANPTIVGQLFHIVSPALKMDRTFAAGRDVLPSDDVRVASNIKPFVAAAALKLVETGQLSLDTPIGPYLSAPIAQILRKGGRQIDRITLRHLLTHTSGLADCSSSRAFQVLAYIPTAFGVAWHWTPNDQIWFAANLTPKGQVGTSFDYSDTNYLLASDMIAKATGKANAGIALRQLLNWPALGAGDAFWEFYEPIPTGTRLVRHFRGAIEDTHLDVSFDQYGGGGMVMSMRDLAFAHGAIIRGDVFAQPTTTATLMQTPPINVSSSQYALGIFPMNVAGETCWSHGGRWGTIALHCPRLDVTIARSWGQSNGGPDALDPNGPVVALIKLAQQNSP